MNNFTCPYNSFCAGRAIEACNDTAMMDCPECNYGSYVALMFIASVLAVMIILGNSLTIWIFAQRCKNGCDMKMDAIKLSLAVSDLLTGIQIFTSYIPNISRAFHSTIFEDRLHRRSHSVSAFCGFLNTLAFVSSLYHLLLLGMQRIYAVKCPLKFRHRNMKPVYAWISVVWLIAILIALAPTALPDLRYGEIHYVCFLLSEEVNLSFIIIMSFALVIPFMTMIIISIITTILVRQKLNSSDYKQRRRLSQSSENSRNSRLQQQIALFKTIAFMQIGFVVTVGPGVGGLLVYLSGALSCYLFEVFLMACFVIYFMNSLVNVIVYSFREKKFRLSVNQSFEKLKNIFHPSTKRLGRQSSVRQSSGTGTVVTTFL